MLSFLLEALKFIGILFCVLMVFNFIIIVHEWGHFLAARWRGLKIEKFQIWMGKCLWKRTWNGVQYGLGTIPIGGFVQLPQMSPMEAIEGKSGENKEVLPPIKPIDKIIVAFAGPLFSFLLAVAFACGVSIAGKPVKKEENTTQIGRTPAGLPAAKSGVLKPGDTILEIDGKPVHRFIGLTDSVTWAIAAGHKDDVEFKIQRAGEAEPRTVTVHAPLKEQEDYVAWEKDSSLSKLFSRPPLRKVGIAPAAEGKIKTILDNSPAAEAGLKKGDVILTVNGEKSYYPFSFLDAIPDKLPEGQKTAAPLALTVKRGDKVENITVIPRVPDKPANAKAALTGIEEFEELEPEKRVYDYPAPFALIGDCFRNTFETFRALTTKNSSIGVSQMSGPVGIMKLYYNIFQSPYWWRLVLWFSVVLNVGLAIFNMLPLPVLDGGHITMALLEMARGKALGSKLMEYVQIACVLCLLSFVLFVTFKDVGSFGSDKSEAVEFLPRKTANATP
ncbi:MAG TPA: RIP metalloprotease RseP [Verrucomicrobiales bacterium]|nr:RIP metalloprotease RseP [Verrucomicrobiales bacterium]